VTNTRSHRSQLRNLAARARDLRPRTAPETALVGHFVGALYALTQAVALHTPDRDDDALRRVYPNELRRISAAMARGKRRPPAQWVAEFYL